MSRVKDIQGEWHELESKALRKRGAKDKLAREKEAKEAKERGGGHGVASRNVSNGSVVPQKIATENMAQHGAAVDQIRKRSLEGTDTQPVEGPDAKRPHLEVPPSSALASVPAGPEEHADL